jgi:hypothetical protein
MKKVMRNCLFGLLILNVTPTAYAEVTASQLNSALYKIKENPKDKTAISEALKLASLYFNENGIEYTEGIKEGFPVLLINQSKGSKFNKFASQISNKFDGLTILFNPAQIGARFPSKGFYDTTDHTISVGGAIDSVVNLRNSTFFHELLHGILSTRIYRQGVESIYGLVLAKKNATMLDLLVNPYAKLLTVQELATHAYEMKLSVTRLKNETDEKKKGLIADNIKNASVAAMLISRSLLTELTHFEAGINSGEYEIKKDTSKFGGGVSSHYLVSNNSYNIYLALSPDTKESEVRGKIGAQFKEYITFVKKYKDIAEIVAGAVGEDNKIVAEKNIEILNRLSREHYPRVISCTKLF